MLRIINLFVLCLVMFHHTSHAKTCLSHYNSKINIAQQIKNAPYRSAQPVGPVWHHFDADKPFAEYIAATTNIISDRNPRSQLPCPINTEVTQWLQAKDRLPMKPTLAHIQSPFELTQSTKKVALLYHGLTDSPFSYHSIATLFFDAGYAVRTILLPGHATAADDLQRVTLPIWQQTIQASLLQAKREFNHVLVVGYSTGAALALNEVAKSPDKIQGLVLFSPATEPHNKHGYLAKWIDMIPRIDWIDKDADIDLFKYESFPFAAAALAHEAMSALKTDTFNHKALARLPKFSALSEIDSTIDSAATLRYLTGWANEQDVLMWYGSEQVARRALPKNYKILTPMCRGTCPEMKGMSHVGILQSPTHPYYGQAPIYRNCSAYLDDLHKYTQCKNATKVYIGERTAYNIEHFFPLARITYNPYFDQLTKELTAFLAKL
ncbi:Lysophospholipase [Pseudoalteromonas luteoviolacea B = ATCC 29581]|nr:Lysophospholipase [Pseudoalteromonas luteoviolacea B = ATCC 29581]